MGRISRDEHGTPVLLADDAPLVLRTKVKPEPIPAPSHAAVTTGEALRILQRVDPRLTPDDVADLLVRNSVPRHAAWDRATVEALASAVPELRAKQRSMG